MAQTGNGGLLFRTRSSFVWGTGQHPANRAALSPANYAPIWPSVENHSAIEIQYYMPKDRETVLGGGPMDLKIERLRGDSFKLEARI